MKHSTIATNLSKDRSSKKKESNSKKKNDFVNNSFPLEFVRKYSDNILFDYMFTICTDYLLDHALVLSESNKGKKICDKYFNLLSSDESCLITLKDCEDFETFSKRTFVSLFMVLSLHEINLVLVEKNNSELKGLNDFFLKESPAPYLAYCDLSIQFGFERQVKLVFQESLSKEQSISNSNEDNLKEKGSELLELDENAEITNAFDEFQSGTESGTPKARKLRRNVTKDENRLIKVREASNIRLKAEPVSGEKPTSV